MKLSKATKRTCKTIEENAELRSYSVGMDKITIEFRYWTFEKQESYFVDFSREEVERMLFKMNDMKEFLLKKRQQQ